MKEREEAEYLLWREPKKNWFMNLNFTQILCTCLGWHFSDWFRLQSFFFWDIFPKLEAGKRILSPLLGSTFTLSPTCGCSMFAIKRMGGQTRLSLSSENSKTRRDPRKVLCEFKGCISFDARLSAEVGRQRVVCTLWSFYYPQNTERELRSGNLE